MADDQADRPRSKRLAVFVGLLVFYVLSLGPVVFVLEWLEEHSSSRTLEVASTIAEVVYAPLIWTEDAMPPVYAVLEWYMRLFH